MEKNGLKFFFLKRIKCGPLTQDIRSEGKAAFVKGDVPEQRVWNQSALLENYGRSRPDDKGESGIREGETRAFKKSCIKKHDREKVKL